MAIAAVAIKSTTAETQRGNFAGADLRRASIASAPPRNRTLINPASPLRVAAGAIEANPEPIASPTTGANHYVTHDGTR